MAAHTIDTDGLTAEQVESIVAEGDALGLRVCIYDGALEARNRVSADWAENAVGNLRAGSVTPFTASWTRLPDGTWGVGVIGPRLTSGQQVVVSTRYGDTSTVTVNEYVRSAQWDRPVNIYSVTA